MQHDTFDYCGGDDCYEQLTRRDLGALALAAGVIATAGSANAAALPVKDSDVTVKTPEGECDAYLLHPASGTHPAVVVWPDIFGIRPVFREMGKRLAAEGYTVLVVNPFYRAIKGTPPADTPMQEVRTKFGAGLFADGGAEKDTVAFVSFLDGQAAMKKGGKIGVTGYCMGGPLTMRSAATVPDRFAAAVSYHGGGLVNDQPNSPHLLVPKIKAKYHFAVADSDHQKNAEGAGSGGKLQAAFEAAKNPADIEVYAGAAHGWMVPGSAAYNEAQAEKAWTKTLALFKKALA